MFVKCSSILTKIDHFHRFFGFSVGKSIIYGPGGLPAFQIRPGTTKNIRKNTTKYWKNTKIRRKFRKNPGCIGIPIFPTNCRVRLTSNPAEALTNRRCPHEQSSRQARRQWPPSAAIAFAHGRAGGRAALTGGRADGRTLMSNHCPHEQSSRIPNLSSLPSRAIQPTTLNPNLKSLPSRPIQPKP